MSEQEKEYYRMRDYIREEIAKPEPLLANIMGKVMSFAKAYSDAQTSARDAEIAKLKAEIHNYELRIDSDAEELDRRYAERSLLNAEIKRLREGIAVIDGAVSPMHQDDVYIVKSRIDLIFETVKSLLYPAPVTPSVLPDKYTCVYSFLGVLAKQCESCKEGRFIPAPVTEVPKEDENGLLPCPFCGEAGKLEGLSKISDFGCDATSKDAHKWFPRCSNGNCLVYNAEAQDEQGGVYVDFPTKDEAIAAWNKRA